MLENYHSKSIKKYISLYMGYGIWDMAKVFINFDLVLTKLRLSYTIFWITLKIVQVGLNLSVFGLKF